MSATLSSRVEPLTQSVAAFRRSGGWDRRQGQLIGSLSQLPELVEIADWLSFLAFRLLIGSLSGFQTGDWLSFPASRLLIGSLSLLEASSPLSSLWYLIASPSS